MTSTTAIVELLLQWARSRWTPEAAAWVAERLPKIAAGDKTTLYLSFGMTPRKVGKADLNLSTEELAAAAKSCPGWNPERWSLDQLVRTLFVLQAPQTDAATFIPVLDQLYGTADVGELITLYQALPLWPFPRDFVNRAAEGLRSNIKTVFTAIAHENPYPAEYFSDAQWNQMVLKCLFIGESLEPVIGVDRRANAALANMLHDFAHERWAAKRPVPWELWRCVGPFANAETLADMERALQSGDAVEQQAVRLALAASKLPAAAQLLAKFPAPAGAATTWTQLAQLARAAS